jgi:MurNAc alpha-1-phosphate uridylyltransferase
MNLPNKQPMKAMILAAGRGQRMRPLTDTMPKPLLTVAGKPLIVHQLEKLRRAGFYELVINLGYLGEQISSFLGDGRDFGLTLMYSQEPESALETGGGIFQALPLLGKAPFLVVNSDIWSDYPFAQLPVDPLGLAHLVMVENPPQHAQGDFALANGWIRDTGEKKLTFSGISVLRPELFAGCMPGRFPLGSVLRKAIAQTKVSGEYYSGIWQDIGTPERLAKLNAWIGFTPCKTES